jgi:hypothetical protein
MPFHFAQGALLSSIAVAMGILLGVAVMIVAPISPS